MGINLTKEMESLYNKKYYTILMNEIEDTNKWKNIHVHELKELALLKYAHYLKQSTHSMQSLSKHH
jgi:hypothetical protein